MVSVVTWLNRIGTGLLLLSVVLFAAWIVQMLEFGEGNKRWARISEFHAVWVPDLGIVRNSFKIEKFSECQDIVIEKTMRPIKDGVVQTNVAPIVFKGHLQEKISRIHADKSTPTIFDDAVPIPPLPKPGSYWLTFSAGCTLDGITQRTELVSAKVDVEPKR
jgi:hypothetical protein